MAVFAEIIAGISDGSAPPPQPQPKTVFFSDSLGREKRQCHGFPIAMPGRMVMCWIVSFILKIVDSLELHFFVFLSHALWGGLEHPDASTWRCHGHFCHRFVLMETLCCHHIVLVDLQGFAEPFALQCSCVVLQGVTLSKEASEYTHLKTNSAAQCDQGFVSLCFLCVLSAFP